MKNSTKGIFSLVLIAYGNILLIQAGFIPYALLVSLIFIVTGIATCDVYIEEGVYNEVYNRG